ncbi:MAG TPA: 50S ribosomal protein L24 [Clostridia bacterium]|nr:50S ribosomal protein L24 [Clostridia bacterium]
MTKMNVKKGDNVMVISGKDKGKSGKILAVVADENRVYVEGANIVSKSKKPRNAQDKGGILKQEGKIDASNVMPICPSCKKAVRVRNQPAAKGSVVKTIRVCAKCGAPLEEKKAVAKKTAKKVAKKTVAEKETPATIEE